MAASWEAWPESWIVKRSKKYTWKTLVTIPGVERDYKAGIGYVETPFTMQMTLGSPPLEHIVAGEPVVDYPRFQSEIVYEILKTYYKERGKKMPKDVRVQLKSEIEAEKLEAQESYNRAQEEAAAEREDEGEEIVENSVVLRLTLNADVSLDVEITKSLDLQALFESLCENYEIDEKKKKKLLTLLQTTQNGIA